MNKDDMILISVDDHTVEPPEMFNNHLSKEYVSRITRNEASVGALRRSAEGQLQSGTRVSGR